MTRFWVGGYGPDAEGTAVGIGLLVGDEGRAPTTLAYRGVAAAVASPSWLASHPVLGVVYAALEGSGEVAAFSRAGESSLVPLGSPSPVGEGVCHLAVSPSGDCLVVSCYGDGRVVRIGLGADGALLPAVRDPEASLREELRDRPPSASGVSRAHAAAFLPDGRIASTDLGLDLVRLWRPIASGLVLDHEVALPHGTGPRHMVVHPSGHLHVVTEHSCEVFTLARGRDGRWRVVAATGVAPDAGSGSDVAAELARSRDGTTLYTALRGSDTIAALRVRGAGEIVEPVALAESGVEWPRHHLVHDGVLLVAGQRSDGVAVLDLDDRTGAPGRVRHIASAPTPTVILPVR